MSALRSFLAKSRVFSTLDSMLGRHGVKVFMLHRVCERTPYWPSLDAENFERFIKYVAKNYTVVGAEDVCSVVSSGLAKRNKYAVITFDDGYIDLYECVADVLKENEVKATVFVCPAAIGSGYIDWDLLHHGDAQGERRQVDAVFERYYETRVCGRGLWDRTRLMKDAIKSAPHEVRKAFFGELQEVLGEPSARYLATWDQLLEMVRCGVLTIGAHTMTHPILSKVGLSEAREEIEVSLEMVSSVVGAESVAFAYPNGRPQDYTEEVLGLVAASGSCAAYTTTQGVVHTVDSPYELPRIDVTMDYFSADGVRLDGQYANEFSSAAWLEFAKLCTKARRLLHA
ncbi:polysaccharide deacetylase family protein [Fundidesulfovibrio putealis]|uniref:polysaccharide deacetylase family protein n=1 Tax=Fundidesulfovibrio putealis TaxID=270496 RepID=UPI0004874090|nr:polysaccharide deacetylase family protein [Fundidesulfovibrio putealis]